MINLQYFLLELIFGIISQLFQSATILKMKPRPYKSGQVKVVGVNYIVCQIIIYCILQVFNYIFNSLLLIL